MCAARFHKSKEKNKAVCEGLVKIGSGAHVCIIYTFFSIKRVTMKNKNLEINGACWHKTTFHPFCLSTDDPAFNR